MYPNRSAMLTVRLCRKLSSALVAICVSTVFLNAQSYQGGVRGTVTDAQSAAVTGAKVTLTNEGTGVARSSLTNSDGTYVFSAVDPSTYSVTAESPSFKKYEQKGITVGTQNFIRWTSSWK